MWAPHDLGFYRATLVLRDLVGVSGEYLNVREELLVFESRGADWQSLCCNVCSSRATATYRTLNGKGITTINGKYLLRRPPRALDLIACLRTQFGRNA